MDTYVLFLCPCHGACRQHPLWKHSQMNLPHRGNRQGLLLQNPPPRPPSATANNRNKLHLGESTGTMNLVPFGLFCLEHLARPVVGIYSCSRNLWALQLKMSGNVPQCGLVIPSVSLNLHCTIMSLFLREEHLNAERNISRVSDFSPYYFYFYSLWLQEFAFWPHGWAVFFPVDKLIVATLAHKGVQEGSLSCRNVFFQMVFIFLMLKGCSNKCKSYTIVILFHFESKI